MTPISPTQQKPGTTNGIVGILLAAGAGRRAHGPKALRVDPDGTSWLLRSIAVLRAGGCATVVLVLGCAADRARTIIEGSSQGRDPSLSLTEATDWREGMGASLRSGLVAVESSGCRAALVHLVDLPDVTPDVVARVITDAPPGSASLARATYEGRPGHPVLIGREHWTSIIAGLAGDRGAREYLAHHGAHGVECGDLASGRDRDR